nr:hypothetical protein [Tanacetum cinerariifolium]
MPFDILKQYKKEVNEIRAEKIAENANPLALFTAAQHYPDSYYQEPKPHKSYEPPSKQSSSTRSLTAKYLKKLYKPTNNNLRTSLNPINQNMDTTSRNINEHQTGQFGNQRTLTVARIRETIDSQ